MADSMKRVTDEILRCSTLLKRFPEMRLTVEGEEILLRVFVAGAPIVQHAYPMREITSEAHLRLVVTEMLRRALDEASQAADRFGHT